MASSLRQQELEAIYEARKNSGKRHVPQLSISDDSHHVTEAIGSWYGDAGAAQMPSDHFLQQQQQQQPPQQPQHYSYQKESRPLSFMNAPSERESFEARRARRHGTLLDSVSSSGDPGSAANSPVRHPLTRTQSNEKLSSPSDSNGTIPSPKALQKMNSLGAENVDASPASPPPPLSRQSSTDTAITQFPLNDIDYESSPAAVQQELSNLNALRRMSMNIDNADPDLPSFSNIPTVTAKDTDDADDHSKLFWVPARLHPELAPKEFKTFLEDRVEKIRRRSGGEDSLSPDSLDRSGSGSSLRRKKSMLSHQIDTSRGGYEDGADRLERKRSKGMQLEAQTTVTNLSDLETLVNDPAELVRRMSLDTSRSLHDSGIEVGPNEDIPILPPAGALKRSTRTTYRRGSLKKGERVPFSKRAQQRQVESETDESPLNSPIAPPDPEGQPPILGLTRVQTEPIPPATEQREKGSRTLVHRATRVASSQSAEDLQTYQEKRTTQPSSLSPQEEKEESYYDDRPVEQPVLPQQPKKFQSRIASPGRTTAQLPGYNNTNPLPQIIETLPDGTKVPVPNLIQNLPERKSSHELPRQFQRGGAHMRPVPGREKSSSLDDISSHPSPLPGSGDTRTDALTLVPTFEEERKAEKKETPRKSSWKWILGNDSSDKKSREDGPAESISSKSSHLGKLSKASADKARLDVLQTSIDGTAPGRGRESLVLNREDVKLDEERKKDSKKASEPKREKEKDGLLSAIFGGKKKSSDGDLKEKKRKAERRISPEPIARILKPDIDYNWTRFSILEERAIYRMAHIKLANPRRALYSQVLLSNFMYSYLAKVQMMHPQIQIPAAQRAAQQRGQKEEQQPPEYNQYQRWQEQQAREQAAQEAASNSNRTSFDMVHESSQRQYYDDAEQTGSGHGRESSEGYGRPSSSSQTASGHPRTNGTGGYSVASTHEYLGYPNDQQGLWDDEDRAEDLW